jgi:hypothetical protein
VVDKWLSWQAHVALTGHHACLIWTPLRVHDVTWRKPCWKPSPTACWQRCPLDPHFWWNLCWYDVITITTRRVIPNKTADFIITAEAWYQWCDVIQWQENYKRLELQHHCMLILHLPWRHTGAADVQFNILTSVLQASGQLHALITLLLAITTSSTQGGWAPEPVWAFCRKVFCPCWESNHKIIQSIVLLLYPTHYNGPWV